MMSIFGVFTILYGGKMHEVDFRIRNSWKLQTSQRKTYNIFWILRTFWWKKCAFMQNSGLRIWHFDLALTWPLSKVRPDDVIGSNGRHYRNLMPRKTCICDFLFYSDLLWPHLALGLFSMAFVLTLYSSLDLYQHFERVWAFGSHLTNTRAQNVETLHFGIRPDLTCHMTLILKC